MRAKLELSDEKWFLYLTLLFGISHHLSELYTKPQGQQNLISGMLGSVRALQMKLTISKTVGK
jgi:hypothetical protein